MAVNDEREASVRKASSLDNDTLSSPSRTDGRGSKSPKDRKGDHALSGKGKAVWKGVLVDLIVVILLAGLGVGIFYGYQALKELYAPVWEARRVDIVVEIRNVDYASSDELISVIEGHPLYYGDKADSVNLGTVTNVRWEDQPIIDSGKDNSNPTMENKDMVILYLTVSVNTQYHNKDGYYIGDVRLLAGESAVFRANGMVSEGMIIAMNDVEHEKEPVTEQPKEVAKNES